MHFNKLFYLAIIVVTCGCNNSTTVTQTTKADSTGISTTATNLPDTTVGVNDQYQDFYVAIIDTSNNYYQLDATMYALGKAAHLSIDTMNRYYNKKRGEIIVKEDDEDEMYRGEYYARRFDDTVALSLEHTSEYIEHASPKSFALLAAICERETAADSALTRILPYAPKAYVVKAKLYIGCMH